MVFPMAAQAGWVASLRIPPPLSHSFTAERMGGQPTKETTARPVAVRVLAFIGQAGPPRDFAALQQWIATGAAPVDMPTLSEVAAASFRGGVVSLDVFATVSDLHANVSQYATLARPSAAPIVAIVYAGNPLSSEEVGHIIAAHGQALRRDAKAFAPCFSLVWCPVLSLSPSSRLRCVDEADIKMVSHITHDIGTAILRLVAQRCDDSSAADKPHLTPADRSSACSLCGLTGMNVEQLWLPVPMFHINHRNVRQTCGVCGKSVDSYCGHVHDDHRPAPDAAIFAFERALSGAAHAPAHQTQLHAFALCVVRRPADGKFLLVQEYCNQGYWLPGGMIDGGEDPATAALREAVEEVGIRIVLKGILRIETAPRRMTKAQAHMRIRYFFYAEPVASDAAFSKTIPDFESAGACWVTADEINSGSIRLRNREPVQWCTYVARGGAIYPMSLMGVEGSDPPTPNPS